jgi:hypothetical protein|tara:strand:- start:967 stop:1128 length:162 start_codon:yes stop_codon:yes gene_type:complete
MSTILKFRGLTMNKEKHITFDTWESFDNWLKGGLIKKTNQDQVDYVFNEDQIN